MLNIDDRLIKEVSPKIGPNALSVLLAIAIHLNQKTNRCFPSHHRLMELTGIGRDATYKALKTLQENGLLSSEQKMGGRGNISRRVFRLSTDFISIFVSARNFTLPENTLPENTDAMNTDTYFQEAEHINKVEQIKKKKEQIKCEGAPAEKIKITLIEETLFDLEQRSAREANEVFAAIQKSVSFNTEPSKKEPPQFRAAPLNLLSDYPKAQTARDLENELSAFYHAMPNQWQATKDGTPAANWPDGKTAQVFGNFCAWAISEGWERRSFGKINARLRRWFLDEPTMGRIGRQPETNPSTRGAIPQNVKRYGS